MILVTTYYYIFWPSYAPHIGLLYWCIGQLGRHQAFLLHHKFIIIYLPISAGYECFSSSSSSTSTAGGKNSFSNEKLKASLNRPKVSRDHLHHQQEKAAILAGATNSSCNTTAREKIINGKYYYLERRTVFQKKSMII